MTTVEAPRPTNGLKKLGFVPEASAKSYEIASSIYVKAKSYVPESLQPRLEKVEESVANVRDRLSPWGWEGPGRSCQGWRVSLRVMRGPNRPIHTPVYRR